MSLTNQAKLEKKIHVTTIYLEEWKTRINIRINLKRYPLYRIDSVLFLLQTSTELFWGIDYFLSGCVD